MVLCQHCQANRNRHRDGYMCYVWQNMGDELLTAAQERMDEIDGRRYYVPQLQIAQAIRSAMYYKYHELNGTLAHPRPNLPSCLLLIIRSFEPNPNGEPLRGNPDDPNNPNRRIRDDAE
jgi:hypothetical protein